MSAAYSFAFSPFFSAASVVSPYGAGHFRLAVSDTRVAMECYPGDATAPARTFILKET